MRKVKLTLLAILCCFSIVTNADTEVGKYTCVLNSDMTCTLTGFTSAFYSASTYYSRLSLPDSVTYNNTGYKVTAISNCEFDQSQYKYIKVTEIYIGKNVKTITNSFNNYTGEFVSLGYSVVTIENSFNAYVGTNTAWHYYVQLNSAIKTVNNSFNKYDGGLVNFYQCRDATVSNSFASFTSGDLHIYGTFAEINNSFNAYNPSYTLSIDDVETITGSFNAYTGKKLIFGDNVKKLKASSFNGVTEGRIVLGRNISYIGKDVFLNFGKDTYNNKVILLCDTPPVVESSGTFADNMKNCTFYVKDSTVCKDYSSSKDAWGQSFVAKSGNIHQYGTAGVGYCYPTPGRYILTANKWTTVCFPTDVSRIELAPFGVSRIAYLKNAKRADGEYRLYFEEIPYFVPEAKTPDTWQPSESVYRMEAYTPYMFCPGVSGDCYIYGDIDPTVSADSCTMKVRVENTEDLGEQWAYMTGCFGKTYLKKNEFYLVSTLEDDVNNLSFSVVGKDGECFVNTNECFFGVTTSDVAYNPTPVNPTISFDPADDRGATGIKHVITEPESTVSRDNAVYSITGQYLGTDWKVLPAGVYIINGKKVMIGTRY